MTAIANKTIDAGDDWGEDTEPTVDHDAESERHAAAVRNLARIREQQESGVGAAEAEIARCRAALADAGVAKLQADLAAAERKLIDLRSAFTADRAVNLVHSSWPTRLRDAWLANERAIDTARNLTPVEKAIVQVERLRARRDEIEKLGTQAMTAVELERSLTKLLRS